MSTNIVQYLGAGTAASRPVTPAVFAGCMALYYATDTLVWSLWNGSAWIAAGASVGTPPTIVQSKASVASSKSITLDGAPVNGNLLVAMCFNPTTATAGSGWTAQASVSTGTDYGTVFTKVAGGAESATQTPLNTDPTPGSMIMWELNGQAASQFFLQGASQAEGAALIGIGPTSVVPKGCLALAAMSLVSASNNIENLYGLRVDQSIKTGANRQIIGGHLTGDGAFAQPIVTFDGAGTPGYKGAVCIITS